MPRRPSPMFYPVSTFRGMKPGDTVIHSGQRMRLVALEAIPGGTSARLEAIPGVEYPHPIYRLGFTDAADNIRPA